MKLNRWFAPLLSVAALLIALPGRTTQRSSGPPPVSLLIKGGTVIDGAGGRPRKADVLILNDRIQRISANIKPNAAMRVIDATGKVVAPGFIDTHSHADSAFTDHPDLDSVIRQGITTVTVGQDGGSTYTMAELANRMETAPVSVNVASFAGYGSVRKRAMGEAYKRPATAIEIERMKADIINEMEAGALGISTGLEYDPDFYSTTDELVNCARAIAPFGGLYISHMRNEDNTVFKALDELLRISREAQIPAQVSHIKLGSKSVWGRAGEMLAKMRDARRFGNEATADVYPYLFWQSSITVLTPTRDWEDKAAWRKGLDDIGGAEHVRLSSYTPNAAWAGKTLAQIATQTRRDVVDVIQEIVRKTHGPGKEEQDLESVVVTAMTEEDLAAFLRAPNIMFCTDGVPGGTHPRAYGSFPRILGRYVRDQKTLTLTEAIRKMTSLPARRMGFPSRGILKAGKIADIVIFDPEAVRDTATVEKPQSAPVGIETVLINGIPVMEQGKRTPARPGLLLRHESFPDPAPWHWDREYSSLLRR